MGFEKIKRPLLAPGVAVVTPGSAAGDPAGVIGEVQTGGGGLILDTATLTGTDAAQTLSASVHFVTQATSNLSNDFLLPAPQLGEVKLVAIANNATGEDLSIHANATAAASNFFGTTFNTITVAAGSTATMLTEGTPLFMFVGVSTAQWTATLLSGSTTSFTFSNTTGSTGQ